MFPVSKHNKISENYDFCHFGKMKLFLNMQFIGKMFKNTTLTERTPNSPRKPFPDKRVITKVGERGQASEHGGRR